MKALRIIVGTMLAGCAGLAAAQAYPSKPVRVIVPFAAGSGTDILGRIIAEELRTTTGANFVVDNRPGASAQIASELGAKSPPDGYTILLSTNTGHSANPYLFKKLNYDPVKDFTPVARAIYYLFIIAVNPSLPIRTPQELVAWGRANPGKFSYAFGNGTGQVAAAYFAKAAGLEALPVPYKSTPPAMTDIIGGQVPWMFVDWASSQGHVKAGRLRAIGTMSEKRSTVLPELPAAGEAVPGFDIVSWAGFFGPAGLPPDVVARLSSGIVKAIEKPGINEKLVGLGLEPAATGPEELRKFVAQQLSAWGKKIREAGIQPE